ncbi:MAG TPA: aromatic ring-hydroxylating dioxygenase subunit alpha [Longimicrobiaceae bacterium]|nr:aromatic ring-hydroxylating dioxygenase subunit alpha [Longimicrobiaceae bacterium]
MPARPFAIDPDITRAQTLPADVYHDPEWYARMKERVFTRSWQLLPGADRVKAPGHLLPLTLLEGCLDEPLVLAMGEDGVLRCLSNVCTHRGTVVCEGETHAHGLRCRYHGRRFALDGKMTFMPEFDGVANFPSPADDLPRLPLERWGALAFTSLDPACPFEDWIAPVRERVGFLPLERFVFDPATSRDYHIRANWALYVDNYLEEFHIPYIHGSLSGTLDYSTYRTETFDWCSLQLGTTKSPTDAFALPAGHPDEGTLVAAYYWWVFPNLMLNFYPWGLSVNVVEPQGPERSRVRFLSYVLDASKRESGAGADLHRVEMEDEEVVEAVQKGVKSRLYDRGRYSPRREVGTHHFHTLLAAVASPREDAAADEMQPGARAALRAEVVGI